MVRIIYTTDLKEAQTLIDKGYEPIEYSSGSTTLVGKITPPLDHHGKYSNLPPIAVRGQTELFDAVSLGKITDKFVINHLDADIVVCIAGLLGIKLPMPLVQLISEIDVKGRHKIDWLNTSFAGKLLRLWQILAVKIDNGADVTPIIMQAIGVLTDSQSYSELVEQYKAEFKQALADIKAVKNGIALAIGSSKAGFEAYYTKAPIVVAFNPNTGKITIGAVDEQTAKARFGEQGLLAVASKLGAGWGGRPSIIGSPRETRMTEKQAWDVFNLLTSL
jgi:hypothetical protein